MVMNMRSISRNNKEFYENFYSVVANPLDLYEIYFRVTSVKRLTSIFSSLKEKKILDIGFGSGGMLSIFDSSCEIYGIDISKSSKERFSKKSNKFKKTVLTVRDLNLKPEMDFPENFFDIIIMSHILEHLKNYKKIIEEAYKSLKKGGIAFIILPIDQREGTELHEDVSADKILTEIERVGFSTIYSERNLSIPRLPLAYVSDKNATKLIVSNISLVLNFMLSRMGYDVLKVLDYFFAGMGIEPRQQIVMVKK